MEEETKRKLEVNMAGKCELTGGSSVWHGSKTISSRIYDGPISQICVY